MRMLYRTLILVMMLYLSGCGRADDQQLVIVGNSWLGYQPYYVLSALHPERLPNNLETVMLASDNTVLRMVSNQAVQGSFLSLDNALALNTTSGINYCVALAMSFSNGADAVVVNPHRFYDPSRAELVVGMEDSPLARYVLNRWLAHANIDRRRIQPILMSPSLHVSAMQQGVVDAIITYQPFMRQLKLVGNEVIFSTADIPGEVLDVLVFRLEHWQAHQQRLQQLVSSWETAVTFTQQQNSKEFAALAELSGLSSSDVSQIVAQIEFLTPQQSFEFLQNDYPRVMALVSETIVASGGIPHVNALPVCPGVKP